MLRRMFVSHERTAAAGAIVLHNCAAINFQNAPETVAVSVQTGASRFAPKHHPHKCDMLSYDCARATPLTLTTEAIERITPQWGPAECTEIWYILRAFLSVLCPATIHDIGSTWLEPILK